LGEKDMVFRLSRIAHQPPFYRELRDADGMVQPNTKAQQSVHFVLGDYSFKMWDVLQVDFPSCITNSTDVNTYTIGQRPPAFGMQPTM
jgi:hypothetical protein